MATTKTKRPPLARTNDVDRLASSLGSRLNLTDAPNASTRPRKGARTGQSVKAAGPPEESRAAAMKSVNNVLQSLAALVQTRGNCLNSTVLSSATAGRAALNILRKLDPQLIDTERAALCMAGKLIALNAYRSALDILEDIQNHLPSLYHHEKGSIPARKPIALLQLPLPTTTLDPSKQSCIQIYLSHSLSVVTHIVSSKRDLFNDLCDALDGPLSLRSWSVFLTALDRKCLDTLFKRAYASITSTSLISHAPPSRVLKIRFHALRILLLSNELDVTPFWQQCLKYAASYAQEQTAKESENEKVAALLDCFADIDKAADGRREGKGWIAFCEYWLALAKRAGDMHALEAVAAYIRNAASSSSDVTELISKACTVLTQLTTMLDQASEDGDSINSKIKLLISDMQCLRQSLSRVAPLDRRFWRCMERCRKAFGNALSRYQIGSIERTSVIQALSAIIDFLEDLVDGLAPGDERTDATISGLDSLFQLATAVFNPNSADSCDVAYDYLTRGLRLIERSQKDRSEEKRAIANCLRCLSGAFANLAGALYKAERHGLTIRFLTQACSVSGRASEYYPEFRSGETGSDKDHDAWVTHQAQVYRRWELLGVCYVKTGDRRLAHSSFIQGVVTYPFEDDKLRLSSSCDFETPAPLANAIDRLTHIAVLDLRLNSMTVSLRQPLEARGVPAPIIGSILIRQISSLSDLSKPHTRAAVSSLLADALNVYDAVRFPIRRARTLVLVLEHTYYGADKDSSLAEYCPENVLQETEVLLSEKINSGEDVAFTHLRLYYKAVVSFWTILHVHRSGGSAEHVTKRLQQALNTLETLVAGTKKETAAKVQNPVRGQRPILGPTAVSKAVSKTNRLAATSSSTLRNVRSASARRPPVSSKTSGSVLKAAHEVEIKELSISERTSLAELLLMVADLLDLSGFILLNVRLLTYVCRLLEKPRGSRGEVFLRATSMLSHLLMKIGKPMLASEVLAPVADEVRQSALPSSSAVLVLLRYAELLSFNADIPESSSVYEDAFRLAEALPDEDGGKGVSAISRIRSRAVTLERTAIASNVFATIQDAKNEPTAALKSLLQALRLLNRATETLARLNPVRKIDSSPDPFAISDVKDALPASSGFGDGKTNATRVLQPGVHLDGLEWRIAKSLLETQLALANAYSVRGSVREAEYFEQQAEELARMLGSSAMTTRALLQKSELQMALGDMESARSVLEEARDLAHHGSLFEIDVRRAIGDRLLRCSQESDAQVEFDEAEKLLEVAKKSSESFNRMLPGSSKSESVNAFVPVLRAKIMRQQVWLLRDALGERYEKLLENLFAVAEQPSAEMHVNSVLGRLALYDIHERFRADMSLSSLAESIIALPSGMTNENSPMLPPQDILDALGQADEHYISDLSRFSDRDSVINVRSAAVAEALISAYHASIGISFENGSEFASHLLDMACAITVRRELLDAISSKFPNPLSRDDMQWPLDGLPTGQRRKAKPKGRGIFDDLSGDDDVCSLDDRKLREYWDYILKKHQAEAFIQSENAKSEVGSLPKNWMVITISLTESKNALLLSRQRPKKEPMVFYVPLKGRGEDEDEGHFTFDSAMDELNDIIKLNDEGAKGASQIKPDDKEAKIAWWDSRKRLDQRMKDLVENIEFCWLGAFKVILNQPMRASPDAINNLRSRLEKVFKGILGSHEKKSSKRSKLHLDTGLLEIFAALPPSCRDEELQDLVYFILDLYHFHGLSVAVAEVEMDLVVIDLRSALEEFRSRINEHIVPEPDAHTFLVLDKNVQGIPWESLPVLRGHSVSRVPSISFITDRLAWARSQRGLPLDSDDPAEVEEHIDRVLVDPSKGYYLLNPSGDLSGTEGRFRGWVNELRKVGWDGVVGKEPSEQQFLNALSQKDLVVYFGHGGAEQYARSHRIRHLQRCAATMLWGCSSGALRDMGDFDRIGTPNNYMIAGCPSLVANLWDVTDRDIDKFAQSVFTKLRLEPGEIEQWKKGKRGIQDGKTSIVAAVAQSRDVCKLKYLTGAAVVVYGIPYYL